MNQIEVAILLEFVFLSLYVGAHALVSRHLQPERRWQAMKRQFLVFALLTAAVGYLVNQRATAATPTAFFLIAAVIIVWLIHIGYLTVYAVFDRSISLRVVIELNGAGSPITFQKLEELYDPTAAFERRLEILVESGFLVHLDGQYALTEKGQRTARLVGFLKNFYRFGEGG